jgi:hypothetical protein
VNIKLPPGPALAPPLPQTPPADELEPLADALVDPSVAPLPLEPPAGCVALGWIWAGVVPASALEGAASCWSGCEDWPTGPSAGSGSPTLDEVPEHERIETHPSTPSAIAGA